MISSDASGRYTYFKSGDKYLYKRKNWRENRAI